MRIFKFLKSILVGHSHNNDSKEISNSREEAPKETPNLIENKVLTEPSYSMSQAAKKNGTTRQAIWYAIKMKRLNAVMEDGRWRIPQKDLIEYFGTKYCRSKSTKEGELIFDKDQGYYSISEASEYLKKPTNHIYYLVRVGKLHSHKRGSAIVIKFDELKAYADSVKNKTESSKNSLQKQKAV